MNTRGKNEQKHFNRNAWYLASLKYGEDDLVKFIIQQNYVQLLLQELIIYRTNLSNRKLIDQIENETLGQLKKDFQLLAKDNQDEAELIRKIEDFNTKRVKIIHKLFIINSNLIDNASIKNIINDGRDIIKNLNSLKDTELNRLEKNLKIVKTNPTNG
jgi:hypothetical protein